VLAAPAPVAALLSSLILPRCLCSETGRGDVFAAHIRPQIVRVAVATALAAQDAIEPRKACGICFVTRPPCAQNSFEIFGYDFMVDDQLSVWLIEVSYAIYLLN